jgi:hypothetical protein
MVVIDLRPGEGLDLDNGRIVIHMKQKSGQIAKLAVDCGKDVAIRRLDGVPSPVQLARQGLTRGR